VANTAFTAAGSNSTEILSAVLLSVVQVNIRMNNVELLSWEVQQKGG
jgi:hypothetical protein